MARYYQYHLDGTGIVLSRPALDPWIGIAAHDMLAGFIQDMLTEGTGIERAPQANWNARLDAICRKRGETAHTGAEAGHLAYSLALGWWYIFESWLAKYEIVAVEREFEMDLDGGRIKLMVKPDLVIRSRDTKALTIVDFKTMGSFDEITTPAQYRESVQIALMTKAVETVLGEPINTFYIAGMVKGTKRHFEKDGNKSEERRFHSHLCYASEPKAPFNNWTTKGYWYNKTPVWTKLSPSEWIQHLRENEPAILTGLFPLMGPFQRQTHMIEQAMRFVVGSENRWIEKLWGIYDNDGEGGDWLDSLFNRSYGHCTSFYGDVCPFMTLCYKLPGHEDPVGSGLYLVRTPHHKPELDRFLEDGVVITPEPWEES
jgi:hypothetical protein